MKFFLLKVCFFLSIGSFAQSVISSSGNSASNGDFILSWTIGEGVISTIGSNDIELTQGFHLVSTPITQAPQLLQPDYEYGLILADGEDLEALLEREEPPCACLKVKSCSTAAMSESYSSPEVYQVLIRAETKP